MPKVRVKITFNELDRLKTFIETDAKPEAVGEILEMFLVEQMGQGEDDSEPQPLDIYTVDITLELADDSLNVVSNTGNKGLTCGIVMTTLDILRDIAIHPLP